MLKKSGLYLPEQKIRKAKKPALATAGAVFWLSAFLEADWNKID
jgi:hypothetical protein